MTHKDGFAKNAYRKALNASAKILGVRCAKQLDAKIRFGRKLNLRNPITLADKVSWLELNTDQSLPSQLTDKYAVRTFVEQRGFEDIIVPLCGGPWINAEEIDFETLPQSFVIKATHGCGMNLVVEDKEVLDIPTARKKLNKWLHEDYPRACIEPHYQKIPRRLYAEEMLDSAESIIDYKFHCFDGEPQFVLVCSERTEGLKLSLFDPNWKPLMQYLQNTPIPDSLPAAPDMLKQMLEVARGLAQGFPFVRVDLYAIRNKVYFGEMTFSPAAGVFDYYTDEFIKEWGTKLDLGEYVH